jgi:hypothetical protein
VGYGNGGNLPPQGTEPEFPGYPAHTGSATPAIIQAAQTIPTYMLTETIIQFG